MSIVSYKSKEPGRGHILKGVSSESSGSETGGAPAGTFSWVVESGVGPPYGKELLKGPLQQFRQDLLSELSPAVGRENQMEPSGRSQPFFLS